MFRQYASHPIFIDRYAKGIGNDERDPRATIPGITLFDRHDGRNQLRGWPPGSGSATAPGRKQQAVLALHQRLMESKKGGGFDHHGGPKPPARR